MGILSQFNPAAFILLGGYYCSNNFFGLSPAEVGMAVPTICGGFTNIIPPVVISQRLPIIAIDVIEYPSAIFSQLCALMAPQNLNFQLEAQLATFS